MSASKTPTGYVDLEVPLREEEAVRLERAAGTTVAAGYFAAGLLSAYLREVSLTSRSDEPSEETPNATPPAA